MDFQCSIVIPAYNAEKYIDDALRSVFGQDTSLQYEIIVVDDGSTDQTLEVLSKYGSQIRVFEKSNGGPGSARNLAVENAKSDIIIFLDADDKMISGRLQDQGLFMLNHPEATVSFGDMVTQGSTRSALVPWGDLSTGNTGFVELIDVFNHLVADGCHVCNSASAVRRPDFLSIGMQRTDIRVAEDFDFWCRLAASGHRFFMSRNHFTWVRRDDHGNLMSSLYAYNGPAIVLAEQVRAHGDLLSQAEKRRAQHQLDWRSNMYLRYLWAFDRCNLRPAIIELSDVVSFKIIFQWNVARMIPAWVGRMLRSIKQRWYSVSNEFNGCGNGG